VTKRTTIFEVIVCLALLTYPLAGQISISDLQGLEGSWECRTSAGTSGVFISAYTSILERGGNPDITGQMVNFRIYQRQGTQEHWGYLSTLDPTGSTVFDGKRLAVHFKNQTDIPPFDLDVRFDFSARRWTGVWSLCEKSREVVIERPHAHHGVPISNSVGDWEGYADPTAKFRTAPGTLHIRSSYDGTLIAWLDRAISGYDPRTRATHTDQRNGEELRVLSVTPSSIVLQTVGSMGVPHQYEGKLVGDGKEISGEWLDKGGGRLNAPALFRLADPSAQQ
jgi:hypothetical protein